MHSFRAALFDLDGTLIDTEGQYSQFWTGLLGRYGLPSDIISLIKGTTLADTLDRYFPSADRRREVTAALDAFEAGMDYALTDGAAEFLSDIRSHGVKTAVVTSSNSVKISRVRRGLPGFLESFDAVLGAEDFPLSKPDPSCYLTAAARLSCSRDECVVFEDAPNGLRAGCAAGIFTVAVGPAGENGGGELSDWGVSGFAGLHYEDIAEVLASATPGVQAPEEFSSGSPD